MLQSRGSESANPMTHRAQSLSATDTRGKHRIQAELKRLEQETKFLEVLFHPSLQFSSIVGYCSDFVLFSLVMCVIFINLHLFIGCFCSSICGFSLFLSQYRLKHFLLAANCKVYKCWTICHQFSILACMLFSWKLCILLLAGLIGFQCDLWYLVSKTARRFGQLT